MRRGRSARVTGGRRRAGETRSPVSPVVERGRTRAVQLPRRSRKVPCGPPSVLLVHTMSPTGIVATSMRSTGTSHPGKLPDLRARPVALFPRYAPARASDRQVVASLEEIYMYIQFSSRNVFWRPRRSLMLLWGVVATSPSRTPPNLPTSTAHRNPPPPTPTPTHLATSLHTL